MDEIGDSEMFSELLGAKGRGEVDESLAYSEALRTDKPVISVFGAFECRFNSRPMANSNRVRLNYWSVRSPEKCWVALGTVSTKRVIPNSLSDRELVELAESTGESIERLASSASTFSMHTFEFTHIGPAPWGLPELIDSEYDFDEVPAVTDSPNIADMPVENMPMVIKLAIDKPKLTPVSMWTPLLLLAANDFRDKSL